jgi:hypothetical protein
MGVRKISFVSIYSGKRELYELDNGEYSTSTKCPIDGTLLYSTSQNSGRDVWEKQNVYCCPNCKETFHSIEEERLRHSKEIMIDSRRKKLSELENHAEHLRKFLRVAEERHDSK